MKILAIGNSFSQDATRFLQPISDHSLFVRNLFIGGCPLQRHAENLDSMAPDYEYQENGACVRRISLSEALREEAWNCITVQQVSGLSGIAESYEPYLTQLLDAVHAACPQAKIFFHRTWSYHADSTHPEFENYHFSREEMYHAIVAASSQAAQRHSLPIIPVGDFIYRLYPIAEKLGFSLYRDNFHLSYDYGRYAAALIWFLFFTDKSAAQTSFAPENTDSDILALLRREADDFWRDRR